MMQISKTADWTDADLEVLEVYCRELGAKRRDVLAVINAESGMFAWAHNPNGHASGILQWMPFILKGHGWRYGDEAFRKLNVTGQLPYLRKYFDPHKGKLGNIAAVYMAVFTPAFIAHAAEPDWVIASKDVRSYIFNANAGFDTGGNGDLKIQVRELSLAVERACRGPRWAEMMQRIGASPPPAPVAYDLATVYGLQQALRVLGFDPGPLDGQKGRLTVAALKAYQLHAHLVADGVMGPRSRASLQAALANRLAPGVA